ncbi:hypothetical protein Q7P35_004254 [Cladosporium inversicolor]
MPSSAVSKKSSDEVAPSARSGTIDSREHTTKASASAGLNLNIFGAVAGVFSGKSKKETAADGSSVEHRDDKAAIKGAGAGNLNAVGAADFEETKKSDEAAWREPGKINHI